MDRLAATRTDRYGADLYDERADRDEHSYHRQHRDGAAPRHGTRKDRSRTPPYGSSGDKHSDWDNRYRERRDWSRGRHDRRSRSPRRDGHRQYTDRDREGYRSPGYGRSRSPSRSRSRSRSPHYGAPPSRTIIMEGVPLDMTQEDISYELQKHFSCEGLDHVRLIRDKRTGVSRRFAFAQFHDVSSARGFLDRYFPRIKLYGSESSGTAQDVKISFSRDKDDRGERARPTDDEWACDVCYATNFPHRVHCYRCNAPRTRSIVSGVMVPTHSTASGLATTGDSDAAADGTPTQYLLFRGLEPGVSEELLAKGVCKLYKAQPEQPIKKSKIASTSDSNPGAREGSLRRVLLIRDRRTNDSWRYGFAEFHTVDDASAALAKYNSLEKFTISSKPVMVSYIHSGVFVPVLQDFENSEVFTFKVLANPSMRLKYWDEAAFPSELNTTKEGSEFLLEEQTRVTQEQNAGGKDSESKSKKRKAEKDLSASSKKVVASHLQFWSNRHAELHGLPAREAPSGNDSPDESFSPDTSGETSHQSFIDRDRHCCLLCARQFKGVVEANKHERLSQMHRDNLKDEKLRQQAAIRVRKLQKQVLAAGENYRDRAKERRQAFGRSKQTVGKQATGAPAPIEQIETPAPSIGAALLGKMGWREGEGLGLNGSGRTEAIATNVYAQGVGLGAEGGDLGDAVVQAGRKTKGSYAEFVDNAKDRARERYQNMN